GAGDNVGHERHEEQQRQSPEHEAEDAVENPGNDAEEPPDSGGLGIVLRVHEIFDALHDWLLHEQNPGTFRVAGVLYHANPCCPWGLAYCVSSSWKWGCAWSGSASSVREKSCRSSGMNPAAAHSSACACGVVISTRDRTSTSSRPTGRLPWIQRLMVERSYPLRRAMSPWLHLRWRISRYKTRPNSVIPALLSGA